MRRTASLACVVCGAALALGAKPNDLGVALFVWGPVVAFLVALGLPLGIALETQFRAFSASAARCAARRTTASALVGAGIALTVLFAVGALGPRAPVLALLIAGGAAVLFLAGFGGCARHFGERMLRTAPGGASLRPLVLGWLARAGLFAVPVAGPFVGAWLVLVAMGVPVVALFDRGDEPPST